MYHQLPRGVREQLHSLPHQAGGRVQGRYFLQLGIPPPSIQRTIGLKPSFAEKLKISLKCSN